MYCEGSGILLLVVVVVVAEEEEEEETVLLLLITGVGAKDVAEGGEAVAKASSPVRLCRLLTKQRSFQRMRIHSRPRTCSYHLRLVRACTMSSSLMVAKGGSLRQYVASFSALDLNDSVSRVCVLKSRISPSR